MKKSHKPFSNLKQKHTKSTCPSVVPSPSSSHISSPQHSPLSPSCNGSPLSQPQLVDLARCNHQKFWKSVTRSLARYLTCYRETESRPKANRKGRCRRSSESKGDEEVRKSCRYYSEMSDEERAEKLRSAINYCNANCNVT